MSVPEPAPRRGRPRRPGTREAVIEAFVTLIGEQGYAATSMDEVAERAGVSKATIYRRWPSRDALIVDIHHAMVDESDARDTGSLEGDLLALLERVAWVLEQTGFARLVVASAGEMLSNPELASVFRERALGPRLALMETVFRRAIERGEVDPAVDWRSWAYTLIGTNIFRVAFMGEAPDREANRQLVRAIVRQARGEAHRDE